MEFLIRTFLWNTSGPFLLSFQLYLNRRFTLLLFSGNFLNSCSFKFSWVVTIQHYTARLLYQTLAKHLTIPSRHLCCRPASVKLQALPCLTCYNGTSPVIFEGGFVFFLGTAIYIRFHWQFLITYSCFWFVNALLGKFDNLILKKNKKKMKNDKKHANTIQENIK